MRWGRRRKERGTSGMAGWWLEARERASASRPWEHSSMAMAAAPSERERQRERVPEREGIERLPINAGHRGVGARIGNGGGELTHGCHA